MCLNKEVSHEAALFTKEHMQDKRQTIFKKIIKWEFKVDGEFSVGIEEEGKNGTPSSLGAMNS